jgi:hypothetical protein
MKTTTPQLAIHLSQENTTLARLLKISRLDRANFRFTDFDKDISFSDAPFQSAINSGTSFSESVGPVKTEKSNAWALYAVSDSNPLSVGAGWSSTAELGVYFQNLSSITVVTGLSTARLTNPTGGTAQWPNWAAALVLLDTDGGTPAFLQTNGIFSGTWAAGVKSVAFGTPVTAGSAIVVVLQVQPEFSNGPWNPNPSVTDSQGNEYFKVSAQSVLGASYAEVDVFVAFAAQAGALTVNLRTTGTTPASAGAVAWEVSHVVLATRDYKAADGVSFSALETKDDGSPNNTQVSGFLSSAGITAGDVRARLYDGATFEHRAVNWADATMGDIKMLSGTVGNYEMKNGLFTAELRGLTQKLTTIVGSLYGPLCRAELFGGGATLIDDLPIDPTNHWKCRLNRADWVQNGTLESSPDTVTLVPYNNPSVGELVMRGSATPLAVAPAGWFDDGVIVFTSGVLSGYKFEIATWDGTALTLFAGGPMPFAPAPGDTFEIEPGCDKRKETCDVKFNNVINHAGEADIPGLNVIGAVSRTQVVSS